MRTDGRLTHAELMFGTKLRSLLHFKLIAWINCINGNIEVKRFNHFGVFPFRLHLGVWMLTVQNAHRHQFWGMKVKHFCTYWNANGRKVVGEKVGEGIKNRVRQLLAMLKRESIICSANEIIDHHFLRDTKLWTSGCELQRTAEVVWNVSQSIASSCSKMR